MVRAIGIWLFRLVLRPILGKPVRDPTSGFVGVNREALQVFSQSFPLEYPEIEALVVLQRKRFRFQEVPVKMRPRQAGRSTITAVKSLYYIVHVLLGVFVNILKFERRAEEKIIMERLLNAITILSLALMIAVLFSVRRSHIRVEYSVSWLAAAVILLVLSRSSFAAQLDRAASWGSPIRRWRWSCWCPACLWW